MSQGLSRLPADASDRLTQLRQALLELHKTLLEAERVGYEREHGRKVASSGELLQLVIRDPWFAWLHPLSELVVQIDQLLEDERENPMRDAASLLHQARGLLQPVESGSGFQARYFEFIQREPAVVLAHGEVWKVLRADPAPPTDARVVH